MHLLCARLHCATCINCFNPHNSFMKWTLLLSSFIGEKGIKSFKNAPEEWSWDSDPGTVATESPFNHYLKDLSLVILCQ